MFGDSYLTFLSRFGSCGVFCAGFLAFVFTWQGRANGFDLGL